MLCVLSSQLRSSRGSLSIPQPAGGVGVASEGVRCFGSCCVSVVFSSVDRWEIPGLTLPVALSRLPPGLRPTAVALWFRDALSLLSLLSCQGGGGGRRWHLVVVRPLSDTDDAGGSRVSIPGALAISTAASYWAISVAVRIVRAHRPVHGCSAARILA